MEQGWQVVVVAAEAASSMLIQQSQVVLVPRDTVVEQVQVPPVLWEVAAVVWDQQDLIQPAQL